MRVAHLCCGLGGSLWTGAILGWKSIYALDSDAWRIGRIQEQARAGWWPNLRAEVGNLPDGLPPALDGGVDCLAAGFSCRDISVAGKGAGLDGSSTGPTYAGCLRAIDLWRPEWVFFENGPEIKTRGRGRILANLRERGYDPQDGTLSAAEVGAPHRRIRWFLLAHLANPDRVRELEPKRGEPDIWQRNSNSPANPSNLNGIGREGRAREFRASRGPESSDGNPTPSDLMRHGLQIAVQRGGIPSASGEAIEAAAGYCGAHHWNPPLPDVCRVVDGLAAGLDRGRRIEALGDAWVPLQAATAWKILGGP